MGEVHHILQSEVQLQADRYQRIDQPHQEAACDYLEEGLRGHDEIIPSKGMAADKA